MYVIDDQVGVFEPVITRLQSCMQHEVDEALGDVLGGSDMHGAGCAPIA
jgi:hypothetical protein